MEKKRRDYGDKKKQKQKKPQNLPDPYISIPHILMPHEQWPSCSFLTFHCHYHFKRYRPTQFNTNTYIDKSLRNMYYSGVSTPCPRLTIVQQ